MDENELREIAAQLACPSGEMGLSIAESMNEGNAFISARTAEILSPKMGETIAEIGPGNGLLSTPIVEAIGKNGQYIGLELSSEMADIATRNLVKSDTAQIFVHVGDAMDAPIKNGTLDGLFAVNLLYFIEDMHGLFGKISNWLKPGGRAVFGIRSAKALNAIPFTRFGFHIRPLDEIVRNLQSSGFGEVESSYFNEGVETIAGLEVLVDSQIIMATKA